jgi:hypothetical protein
MMFEHMVRHQFTRIHIPTSNHILINQYHDIIKPVKSNAPIQQQIINTKTYYSPLIGIYMNERITQIPLSLNLSKSPEFIFPGAHPVAGRVPALIPIEIPAN